MMAQLRQKLDLAGNAHLAQVESAAADLGFVPVTSQSMSQRIEALWQALAQ